MREGTILSRKELVFCFAGALSADRELSMLLFDDLMEDFFEKGRDFPDLLSIDWRAASCGSSSFVFSFLINCE